MPWGRQPARFAVGLLALSGCGGSWVERARASSVHAEVGRAPLDFAATAIDGRRIHLNNLVGRDVVVLAFWATWCSPCREELGHLKSLDALYRDKGLSIIAVAIDSSDTSDRVPSFTTRNGITFPVIIDEAGEIASWYMRSGAPPVTVIIDRAGNIAEIHEGYGPGDQAPFGAEVRDAVLGPSK